MPKARKRRDSDFQTDMQKSVFYYGEPNTAKAARLGEIQALFLDLVNRDIERIASCEDRFFLQLVKNDKKDSQVRAFEKSCRREGINSAFCQNAFDEAFTKLSNRLNDIRADMMTEFPDICCSKVLFALCLMHDRKSVICGKLAGLYAETGKAFHKECFDMILVMDTDSFRLMLGAFRDAYAMAALERKAPHLHHAEVPLDSRLMRLEESESIKAPYVISITDPENKNMRISVPIRLSRDAERRIHQHKPAASVRFDVRGKLLKVSRAVKKRLEKPSVSKTVGVDTGILDCFHTSDGRVIGSIKDVLGFYQNEVEPAFAYLSGLRNKKRSISHFVRTHKGLPEPVRKASIRKMDNLEHMIREAEAPYRKNRHYYQMLDKEVRDSVSAYVSGCTKDTLTVLEKLDIKDFNKSRKANGMMSAFARGRLQEALISALNWHGFDFAEVPPDYTSQACPVCSNIDSANRKGKAFCCTCCGYTDDADHVGGINIGNRISDTEVMELCKKPLAHAKMQKALKALYAERNAAWKETHHIKIRPA